MAVELALRRTIIGSRSYEIGLWLTAFLVLALGWIAVGWGTTFDDTPGDPLMPLWFVIAMLVLIPGTVFFAISGMVRACIIATRIFAPKMRE